MNIFANDKLSRDRESLETVSELVVGTNKRG